MEHREEGAKHHGPQLHPQLYPCAAASLRVAGACRRRVHHVLVEDERAVRGRREAHLVHP